MLEEACHPHQSFLPTEKGRSSSKKIKKQLHMSRQGRRYKFLKPNQWKLAKSILCLAYFHGLKKDPICNGDKLMVHAIE